MHVEPSTCPVCKKVFDPLRTRALTVSDGRVRAFCSDECRGKDERGEVDLVEAAPAPPVRRRARLYAMIAAGLICVGAAGGGLLWKRARDRARALAEATPEDKGPTGPGLSVTDALKILQARAEAQIGTSGVPERDIWLHPLAGPERRLPIRSTRRFRAARDGMRPDECGSGHCGVDLGEETGEWVFAAHDGVVERVVEEDVGAGGRYVRLNHRGGTLTTAYMHLGAIRTELHPGVPVRAGDPIGTIGDTGINHSGPHLHFQIGVRSRPGEIETFIDPEPLLHLWPLRPPLEQRPPRRLARTARPLQSPGPQGM